MTLDLEGFSPPLNLYAKKLACSSRLKSLRELYVYERPATTTGFAGLLRILPCPLSSLGIGFQPDQEDVDAVVEYCHKLSKLEFVHADVKMDALFSAAGLQLEYLRLSGDCTSSTF